MEGDSGNTRKATLLYGFFLNFLLPPKLLALFRKKVPKWQLILQPSAFPLHHHFEKSSLSLLNLVSCFRNSVKYLRAEKCSKSPICFFNPAFCWKTLHFCGRRTSADAGVGNNFRSNVQSFPNQQGSEINRASILRIHPTLIHRASTLRGIFIHRARVTYSSTERVS